MLCLTQFYNQHNKSESRADYNEIREDDRWSPGVEVFSTMRTLTAAFPLAEAMY